MSAPAADDWRRQGQERYLRASVFQWRRYQPPRADWDHDHCEFCGAKFMIGDAAPGETLAEGYRTEAGGQERWVCRPCFDDFRDEFGFTTTAPPIGA